MSELTAEFGSATPIGFANAKCYDATGKEIVIPKCEKCGCHKSIVIGVNAFAYICPMCV